MDIISMRRLSGTNTLGAYLFMVKDGVKTVELKFQTFPTEAKIETVATETFNSISDVAGNQNSQARAILTELFGDLDGNNPDDLQIALSRYRALVDGS